jgi:hypothetical protein
MKKAKIVFCRGVVRGPAPGVSVFLLGAFLVFVFGCQNKAALSSGLPSGLSKNTNAAGTLSILLPENTQTGPEAKPAPDDSSGVVLASPPAPPSSPVEMPSTVIEIKEKMFIAQTNDVYLNPEDYLEKGIKLEGLFKREGYTGKEYCFVIRYGPGCCGNDGNAGFEVAWDGYSGEYPNVDDWVEVAGVLRTYDEDGYPYLYIALSSLRVLEKRGAEFVTQ